MNLVDRVKGILMTPRAEWAVIATEPASVSSLYTGYIIPLAAIPPLAMFIGWSVIGSSVLGVAIKFPMGNGLEWAVIQYVSALVGVYVLSLIIDALAPSFGGEKNQIQALKVAAYSWTAAWVAGIFAILPALTVLSILGLYSLFLLFLGLPPLMKAPQEKALGYTVVAVIAACVIYIIIGVLTRPFGPMASGFGQLTP